MKYNCLFLLFLVWTFPSFSQQEYLVFFKDKSSESQPIQITNRAQERRKKNGVENDRYDLPVAQEYLTILSNLGNIKHTSRWLNAVHFVTELPEEELRSLSFVADVKVIHRGLNGLKKWDEGIQKSIDCGPGDTQAVQLGVPCLHDAGFTGDSIFMAIIDAGFEGMDTIDFFSDVYNSGRLIETFDFVGGASVYNYSGHGTAVASCIVGKGPAGLPFSGTAPNVDVALYVTEDVGSETMLEEFNLVAALERCDSMGVDIVNISLSYFDFDDSTTSYVYADMDGNTTISAIGVDVAASRGIVVVSAAGNAGPQKIGTPCDADSMLCVGALDGLGNYAWFSSVGPAFDGRVKPDVAARGGGTWIVNSAGMLGQSNGTSFASPTMAGAVACYIQANPTLTAQEIISEVRASASQFSTPDSLIGYGIPDFCGLADLESALSPKDISIFPNPTKEGFFVHGNTSELLHVTVYDVYGKAVISPVTISTNAFVSTAHLSSGNYFVVINDGRSPSVIQMMIQ